MRFRQAAVALSLGVLSATSAMAGDFIDTRLAFSFGDDNILAKSGETTPNSPDAKFGAGCQNTQFYDNFNSRYCGFETLTHLILYKKGETFFPGLTTEAALAILLLEQTNGTAALADDSSYVRLTYRGANWGVNEGISLTGFPVSADRFRLGYAYRITWGGSSVFSARGTTTAAPGAKLQLTRDRWYAFVGAKSTLISNDLIHEQETQYGLLGGAGVDITPQLRLEANGGWFQKGIIPDLAAQGVSAPVRAAGVSAEAVYHLGVPVGQSVDLALYRNDPTYRQVFFAPEAYPRGVSFTVSLEGSYRVQTMEDPDVFAKTVPQAAIAGALQGRLKVNKFRFNLLADYRTVSVIQFDVPGYPPFKDFPRGALTKPEAFVALGMDYFVATPHLTPGFIVGLQNPASITSPRTGLGGNNPPPGLTGSRTVVFRDTNYVSVLPTGQSALPIFSAKATCKWDISETFAAVAEAYYTYDGNRVTFRDDTLGVAEPTFEKPHAIGFDALLQARF